MIGKKGCLAYLVYICDTRTDVALLESILVVTIMLLIDSPSLLLDYDIDFGTDLELGT